MKGYGIQTADMELDPVQWEVLVDTVDKNTGETETV